MNPIKIAKLTAARERLPYNSAQQSLARFTLLLSIPGVGELTAAIIISEIGDISRFSTVKKLVAFAGLAPQYMNRENLSHLIIEFPSVVLLIFVKPCNKLHLLVSGNLKELLIILFYVTIISRKLMKEKLKRLRLLLLLINYLELFMACGKMVNSLE